MTIVVGITGGIASGKTFVSKIIKLKKIPIHESDNVVRGLYKNPNQKTIKFLHRVNLSHSVKKNKINTQDIRNKLFSDLKTKKKIEFFIHNEVCWFSIYIWL